MEAMFCLNNAKRIMEERGLKEYYGNTLMNLSALYSIMENTDKALGYAKKACAEIQDKAIE